MLRQIVSAIWPDHDPARCWMVTYRAYYDTSGSETDPVGAMVVFGYIGPAKRWTRFEKDWDVLVERAGLDALHMKTVWADLKRAHPRDTDEQIKARAEALYEDARHLIDYRLHKPFSVSLNVADYKAVNREYRLVERWAGGWAYTAALCMQRAQEWLQKKHPGAPLLHFFELGDNGQTVFDEAKPQIPDYTYACIPKYDERTGVRVRAFEAMDYLAWETRKLLVDHASGIRLRPQAHEIARRQMFNDRHFNAEHIRALCERAGLERRS